MYSSKQIYDKSSTNLLKYGAFVLVLARIASFVTELVLSLTNYVTEYTLNYFGIIGGSILTVGVFLLGAAMYKIGMSFPLAQNQANSTRTWLFVFAASILPGYIPFVGFVAALIGLVAGIVSFLKLNKLFKLISDTVPQQGKMDSWLLPVYAFYGLITAGLAFVLAFIIVILDAPIDATAFVASVIIGGCGVFVAFGVGFVLYHNSKKLEYIRQNVDFSQLAQIPDPGVMYQPFQPAKPVQPYTPVKETRFCSNCGERIIDTDKFCQTCGADLS